MVTAMRSRLRRYWPEIMTGGMLAFVAACAVNGGSKGLSAFIAIGWTAICIGYGYWMGFRRRHHPLSDMIRETYQVTKRMEEADRAAHGDARPKLTLIRRD